jgi:hypothetical protein
MGDEIPDFLRPAVDEIMRRRQREYEDYLTRYVCWPSYYIEEGGEGG